MPYNTIKKCVCNAAFTSISIVLAFFAKIPISPFLPFLKLDFSDAPAFAAALMFGAPSGIIILVVTSVIRAIFFSAAGIVGLFMRMTSIVPIIILGYLYNRYNSKQNKIICVGLAVVLGTLVKLITNYILWLYFFKIPNLTEYIFAVALPYNFIKFLLSILIALEFIKIVKKHIQ